MAPRCFSKNYSDPPICGVHSAHLIPVRINIDDVIPKLGQVICYVCPASPRMPLLADQRRNTAHRGIV
jgi:hypothetical protein